MNQINLTKTNWISALIILMILSLGFTSPADAGSYNWGTSKSVEANANASAYSGTAPLQVQFNAENSVATEGSISSYQWRLGNGQVQEGMIVNHTFDDPGQYAVRLVVENTLGVSDVDTVYIEVSPRMIHVDDMSISLVSENNNLLKAQVVVVIKDDKGTPVPDVMIAGAWKARPKGGNKIYNWGQGVGITDEGGKAIFESKSTDQEGEIAFIVKYAGVAGCHFIQGNNIVRISTDEQANLAPVVNITSDTLYGPAPFNVTLCGKSCFDPDGEIVDFQWDFGDGSALDVMGGVHEYANPGTYHATLTITDNGGMTAHGEIIIIVTGAPE